MPKIYLSPERRPQGHGKYWGMDLYEHDYCVEVARLTAQVLVRCGFEVKVEEDPDKSLERRVLEAIAWGADCYLPLHTNASSNGTKEGTARGPLVLAYGEPDGVSWRACQAVYDRLMELYPDKGRGVVGGSPFYEIIRTPMLSIYPELAFHDNGQDAAWLVANKSAIAAALAKGLCDWYKMSYKEDNPATGVPEGWVRAEVYRAVVEKYQTLQAKHNALADQIRGLINQL